MDNRSPEIRRYTIDALERYWPLGGGPISKLPMPAIEGPGVESLPPLLADITLPEWGNHTGVEGALLVPRHLIGAGTGEEWARTDWLGTAFWYLNGTAERALEERTGPIHSYAARLRGWDERMWRHAWVNRIALFLRRWAAREAQREETPLLGPLPAPEIIVTHDVDAVRKTTAIRVKQSAFHLFNTARAALRGEWGRALAKGTQAVRFGVGDGDYWQFDEVRRRERSAGVRSYFNWYGGSGGWRRSPAQLLLDPGYDVAEERIAGKLRELRADGCEIGLHQSFEAWRDPERMRREKEHLERSLGVAVTSCRQHWLRFSWRETWKAQETAGLTLDTTLGFNDRPGFRNGAALRIHPWDPSAARQLALAALPMVLMDSHLYDYAKMEEAERASAIRPWLDEVRAVRGSATVIWHVHVLGEDYGWKPGFEALLAVLGETLSVRPDAD